MTGGCPGGSSTRSSPSPVSWTHRQGFPPAMRAKPSQPSDQELAICDWGRFTAGANPHCQTRLFSISAPAYTYATTKKEKEQKLIFCYSQMLCRAVFTPTSSPSYTHRNKAKTSSVVFHIVLFKVMLSFCSLLRKNKDLRSENGFRWLKTEKWETSMCHWVICPGERHSKETGSSFTQVSK